MAKKDFSSALRSTALQQKSVVEDRFSRADSVLLNPAAAPAPVPLPVSEPAAKALVIRDTFSLPPEVHELIESTRQAAAKEGILLNKSDIVRDALTMLGSLSQEQLLERMRNLKRLKPGRK